MLDRDRLLAKARKCEKELVRFCRKAIATPSASCQEEALAKVVADEMRKVGFDEVRTDAFGNVLGRLGSGKTLILLDAHLDTVGVGDPAAWPHDPFEGKLEDGRIFGLGASDQKGALAAMVYAGKLIRDLKLGTEATVIAVASCQQENCDGMALLHLVEKEGLKPDFVVLTDATGLRVNRGHRGRLELRIVVKGRSCHASTPSRGVNAITRTTRIIEQLARLDGKLKPRGFLGKGSVAVTGIECRTPSLNAIPDECTLYVDRRLTAGETKQSVLDQIERLPAVRETQATVEPLRYQAASYPGLRVSREKYFPAWELSEEHPLVRAAARTAHLATGREPVIGKWDFGTSGSATMGLLGIPTVGFGPGDESLSHTTDESVAVEEMLQAMVFYAMLPQALANAGPASSEPGPSGEASSRSSQASEPRASAPRKSARSRSR
jgi:putative selenium metabolism hydrolase